MTDAFPNSTIKTEHGSVRLANRAEIEQCPAWKTAFTNSRKDHRFFQIVEDTIDQGFQYRYLVLEDTSGNVKAFQPFFLVDQDILAGAGKAIGAVVEKIRKVIPRFLKMRTMMVGCAAGEGSLSSADESDAEWAGKCLHVRCTATRNRLNPPLSSSRNSRATIARP